VAQAIGLSFRTVSVQRKQGKGRWQRRTLPRSHPRSTIRARELNCRVRDGAGWTLTALATNTPRPVPLYSNQSGCFIEPHLCKPCCCCAFHSVHARVPASPHHKGNCPRPLVPLSSTHCCASTCGLSSWSSPSGLTPFRDEESHLEVGFPLRCFQRLSAPEIATRLCPWQDNRHTSAPSTPVLSY
jgi:hypothetical protein